MILSSLLLRYLYQIYVLGIADVLTLILGVRHLSESRGKVFYGQEPPSGESTATECGVNYQQLVVIH